jgi:hypothetical protein
VNRVNVRFDENGELSEYENVGAAGKTGAGEEQLQKPFHSTYLHTQTCTKCTVDPSAVCTVDSAVSTGDRGLEVLRYASTFGRNTKLSKSEWVTWALRQEIERGEKTPYPVNAPPVPESVHPVVLHVYQGFIHLLECRWLHTPNAPAPFTYQFSACWSQVPVPQAKYARLELVRLKAMKHVGNSGRAKLWLPGGST